MTTLDARSVGELLLEADQLARDLLYEAPERDGVGMLRTYPEVAEAVADLWPHLQQSPPAQPATDREPVPAPQRAEDSAVVNHLARTVRSIHRVAQRHMPGERFDEDLLQIAGLYTRAGELAARYPLPWPRSRAQNEDLQAAQTRLMHGLYTTTHGVKVALATNLQQAEGQQRHANPDGVRVRFLRYTHRLMDATEQITASFLHADYPETLTGQHRERIDELRLVEAVSRWDLVTHRALAQAPTARVLAYIAQQQAWSAMANHRLWHAAAETSAIDESQFRTRLSPALEHLGQRWQQEALRWNQLAPAQQPPPSKELRQTGGELRSATRELVHDRVSVIRPGVLTARVDLGKVVQALERAVASSVTLAHDFQEATGQEQLAVSARGAHALLRGQAPRPGAAQTEAVTIDPQRVITNKPIPLPDQLRGPIRDSARLLVPTATRALGATSGIVAGTSGPPQRGAARTVGRPSVAGVGAGARLRAMPPPRPMRTPIQPGATPR